METILYSEGARGDKRRPSVGRVLWGGMVIALLLWLIAEMGAVMGVSVALPFEQAAARIRASVPQEKAEQIRDIFSELVSGWMKDSLPACGYSCLVDESSGSMAENVSISTVAYALWEGVADTAAVKCAAIEDRTAGNAAAKSETDENGAEEKPEDGNEIEAGGSKESGDAAGKDGDEDGSEGSSGEDGAEDGSEGSTGEDGEENGSEGSSEEGMEENGKEDEAGGGVKADGNENDAGESGDNAGDANENGSDEGEAEESGTGVNREEAGSGTDEDVVPAVTGEVYTAGELTYDFLISNFYNISSSTVVYESELNGSLLAISLALTEITEEPQILIYHTHSHEFFADSDTSDLSTGIIGVGNYLTELLEGYGYSVLHLTDQFDYVDGVLDRNKAYTYAGTRLKEVLAEYPSIEVMIDLHRDGVDDDLRLVTEVNGKSTAMIMFFNGMSRTTSGDISYLPNENLTENLAFSLQLKVKAEAYYPGFTRKNYIKPYCYNLCLMEKALLIEAGAQTNTFEEVKNAMEPLAVLLHLQLSGVE